MCFDSDELSWKLFEHILQTCGFSPKTLRVNSVDRFAFTAQLFVDRPYLNVFADAIVGWSAAKMPWNKCRRENSFLLYAQTDVFVVSMNR